MLMSDISARRIFRRAGSFAELIRHSKGSSNPQYAGLLPPRSAALSRSQPRDQTRPAHWDARGRLHSGIRSLRSAKWVRLLRLDLNGSAVFSGGAGNDHQVATRYFVRALHHLADWPNGVDDS